MDGLAEIQVRAQIEGNVCSDIVIPSQIIPTTGSPPSARLLAYLCMPQYKIKFNGPILHQVLGIIQSQTKA